MYIRLEEPTKEERMFVKEETTFPVWLIVTSVLGVLGLLILAFSLNKVFREKKPILDKNGETINVKNSLTQK